MASFAGELASDAIHQDWHGLRPPRTRAPAGFRLVHQVHLVVRRDKRKTKETPLPLVFTLQGCLSFFFLNGSEKFITVFSKQFTAYVDTQWKKSI